MSKQWVNLHNHTVFSMLDGHSSVDKYVRRAKELHMNTACITDHGNVHGWLDFYDACKSHGIKPIFGLEAYQARKTRFDRDAEELSGPATNEWEQRGPYHLTILARDKVGYHNLIRLSSRAYTEGYFRKPRIDLDLLSDHAEGLIVLSGCLNGMVQQALLRDDWEDALAAAATMQDIVGKDHYFIEIQDHGLEEQAQVKQDTLKIAKEIGARVVVTGDCHYVYKEDAAAHDIMLCAGTGAHVQDEKRFRFSGDEFYLHSYEEMLDRFEPEWLENTCHLADQVDVDLSFEETHFPKVPDLPDGKSSKAILYDQVYEGLAERYGTPLSDEVKERAEYELRVIGDMGFEDYFLVVGDIVRWAKDNGIRVGPGRGSAAGSIVSYALKITNLDPLRWGLMFERFLVEGRKAPPDIDLDFDSRYRDRVIEYTRQKYGEDRVVHIATFSAVKSRSAIRDAARVLGYEYSVGDRIAKLVPPNVLGESPTIEDSMKSPDFLKAYESDPVVQEVVDAAKGLEGIYRQPGIHAAGVVVTPGPAQDFVPLMVAGDSKDIVTTQWSGTNIERCGLLKIDFLGLRNLDVIDMAVENIKERSGEEVDVDAIPLDDPVTFDMIARGEVTGIFQIGESAGMQEMTLGMRPTSIEDVMAITALYRPGPMGSGLDKMFIDRKHGREPVSYMHDSFVEVLERSYGVMVYQEQVIGVTRALTGWDAGRADDLRRVIGKKKLKEVGSYKAKFVEDAQAHSGVSAKLATEIFEQIEYFAGYGFNLAHAASYGLVSYITAWLKARYPVEYMAALLSSVTSDKDKLSNYLYETRRMGIEVSAPSINASDIWFRPVDDTHIAFGLLGIDGLGGAIVEAIVNDERNYDNIFDFMRRCNPSLLNKGTIEKLTYAGALDELSMGESDMDRRGKLELLKEERGRLGIYVTDHPLNDMQDLISDDTSVILDLGGLPDRARVQVCGLVDKWTTRVTKKGDKMASLHLEDISGSIEGVVFPRTYAEINTHGIEVGALVKVTGKVRREEEAESTIVKLIVEDIEVVDTSTISGHEPITVTLVEPPDPELIEALCDIIESRPGDSAVKLLFAVDDQWLELVFLHQVTPLAREDIEGIVKDAQAV